MTGHPLISVIIPTYRRPDRLRQTLDAVERQTRRPDEVVVVRRDEDEESAAVAGESRELALRTAIVAQPGVLAAMSTGVRAATGEVLVFFDDDAAPRSDWLERAMHHLDDPAVGAVGGRDVVTVDPEPLTTSFGRLTAWGKLVGNQHLAEGAARDVEILKGADMAFRREALALPRNLLGSGAQVHYEVATCLHALNEGWRLVLDPQAIVDHLPAVRHDDDRRERPSLAAGMREAYNLTLAVLTMRPALRLRRLAFGLLIGDRSVPGVARALVAVLQRDWFVVRRLGPSLLGQCRAALTFARGTRVELESFAATTTTRSRPR